MVEWHNKDVRFEKGDKVILHGITDFPEYNATGATVIKYVVDTNRYKLLFDRDQRVGEIDDKFFTKTDPSKASDYESWSEVALSNSKSDVPSLERANDNSPVQKSKQLQVKKVKISKKAGGPKKFHNFWASTRHDIKALEQSFLYDNSWCSEAKNIADFSGQTLESLFHGLIWK